MKLTRAIARAAGAGVPVALALAVAVASGMPVPARAAEPRIPAPRIAVPHAAPSQDRAAATATAAPRASIDALGWLAGHWRGAHAEEVWLEPRGGLMLSVSREIRAAPAGVTSDARPAPARVSFEYLRIEQRDGTLVLQASPGGRPPTPFALAEIGAQRVRFTNTGHDFPQQIIYWREGETLRARIEGVVGGRTQGVDYSWTRAGAAGSGSSAP